MPISKELYAMSFVSIHQDTHTHKHTLGPNEQRKINLKIDSILFAWTVFSFCCCTPLAKGYITFIVVTKIRLQSCNEDRGDDGVKQKKGQAAANTDQRDKKTRKRRRRRGRNNCEFLADFYDKTTTWFRVCKAHICVNSVEKSNCEKRNTSVCFSIIAIVCSFSVSLSGHPDKRKTKFLFRLCCNYLQSNHVNFIFSMVFFLLYRQHYFGFAEQLAFFRSFSSRILWPPQMHIYVMRVSFNCVHCIL